MFPVTLKSPFNKINRWTNNLSNIIFGFINKPVSSQSEVTFNNKVKPDEATKPIQHHIVCIIIDPRCMFNYFSFYLYGIQQLGIKYKFRCLDNFQLTEYQDYRKGVALKVIFRNGTYKQIYIDTNDPSIINENYYSWADVYAKINLSPHDLSREKVMAIGPSFSISCYNLPKTLCLTIKNYLRMQFIKGYRPPLKRYLLDYLYTSLRRKPYAAYETHYTEDTDYVFTLSTLWYDTNSINNTNAFRISFVRACKKYFARFEGGFRYVDGDEVLKQCPEYARYLTELQDVIIHDRIPMKAYLERTKRSAIVFDTPSVSFCHGWKLAEYLCMGKAIISTKHFNVLPNDGKINGKEVSLIVNSTEEIDMAVKQLRDNSILKTNLKNAARAYYETYLSPMAVIKRILERLDCQ